MRVVSVPGVVSDCGVVSVPGVVNDTVAGQVHVWNATYADSQGSCIHTCICHELRS